MRVGYIEACVLDGIGVAVQEIQNRIKGWVFRISKDVIHAIVIFGNPVGFEVLTAVSMKIAVF
jgi:hypothetical protein